MPPYVCLLLQDLDKSCARGGVKRGDVCYGMLRAAACVDSDESDHHALMYVGEICCLLVLIQ